MKTHKKIWIVSLCLVASPVLAQDDPFSLGPSDGGFSLETPSTPPSTRPRSELEIGLGYISKDSFKFGEYTGREEKGPYVIGNVDINRRGAFDSKTFDNDGALYWNLKGRELGLSSRELGLETGVQGDYKIEINYDQLPKFHTETPKTPFRGVGGDTLTLPAGWVAATTTTGTIITPGMTELNNSLQGFKVNQERKNYRIGFSKLLGHHWEFKTQYQHETKEGKKITGAVIGNSGANPRAVLIPEPIDYVTRQLDVVLGFTGQRGQFELGYYGSLFDEKKNSLTWDNPYSAIPGWSAAAGFPTGQGRIALPPDNQFHQILVSGGYEVTKNTRLTVYGSTGRMTQDETFLPYTVNPGLTVTTPLPRSSLDGRIDMTLFDLNLLSHPLDKLNLVANYRYDDRDNHTPQAQYIYIGGDSQNQGAVTSDKARTNLPYSFKQQKLKAEVDYEILTRTHLQGGYEYEETKRDFSEVEKTKEHTYKMELRRTSSEFLTGGFRFLGGHRRGSSYSGNRPYLLSYSNQYTSPQAENVKFDNHPLLRKFNLGNRDRTQFGAFIMAEPHEMATVQLSIDWNNDNYPNSKLGLQDSEGQVYTVDATLTPKDGLTAHAFYTYEHLKLHQKGRYFLGGAPKASQANDANRDWVIEPRDKINTLGVGLEASPIRDKWKVGAEYTYSRSRGKIHGIIGLSVPAGFPTVEDPPLLIAELHRVDLFLKYKIKKSLSAKMNVIYEKLRSRDWALDNTTPTTTANVILLGEKSHNYSVAVLGVSLLYTF